MSTRFRILAAFIGLAVAGCRSSVILPHNPLPLPSSPPAAGVQTFSDRSAGVRFQYPAGWSTGKGETSILVARSPDGSQVLNLDVPALPFHFPGMITPTLVANGYINDVKKRFQNPQVTQNIEAVAAGAPAQRVKITGIVNGYPSTDTALLIVHNDRVYIFSTDGPGTADGLDLAVQTLQWFD